MPLAGQGMLLTSMDIDAADEADFNRWYDREHLEERVAISGFIEARRYVAENANPKYLSLYSTETIDVLDSPGYRARLGSQTDWSKANMAKFKNMIRAVARITVSNGTGRGAVLGIVRLRPQPGTENGLRETLRTKLDPTPHDGIISMHLMESDAALSGPAKGMPGSAPPPDWFVLIDGTEAAAVADIIKSRFATMAPVSSGIYRLMWDLNRGEITAAK